MKRGVNREQGAVLVVALIMLSDRFIAADAGGIRVGRQPRHGSTACGFQANQYSAARLVGFEAERGGFGAGVSRWHRGWHPGNGIDLS